MTITDPSSSATSDAKAQTVAKFVDSLGAGSGAGVVWMQGLGGNPAASGMAGKNPDFLSESGQAQLSRRQQGQRGSWMDATTADGAYFNWTQKQRDDFRAKGLLSGLLSKGAGDLEAYKLWSGLVAQSALYGAQSQEVSPMDLLAGYVKGNSSGGQWVRQGDFEVDPLTGAKRYVGPEFKTTSQTQVNLTDPATARAVATKIFQQLLGRDPNSGEIGAYANALSQSEAQNPSTATTTTQYDMTTGNATNTSTVAAGGTTAEGQAQLAADEIKGKKEYGVTQAATTYMNALHSAVGA